MIDNNPEFKKCLRLLSYFVGVEGYYWDVFGKKNISSDDVLSDIFLAMGLNAGTLESAQACCRFLEEAPFRSLIPPVSVLRRGQDFNLMLAVSRAWIGMTVSWTVRLENGSERYGQWHLADDAVREERELADGPVVRIEVDLPQDIPEGYHTLTVFLEDNGLRASGSLILAPASCWLPETLEGGARRWGVFSQVYALRSMHDWGIGDFSSLTVLAEAAGRSGADMIGVNPLHSLFPARPEMISPYSPSSRLFLNPLYIAVENVPEFSVSADLQKTFSSAMVQQRVEKLRTEAFVDYEAVGVLKRWFFEKLFEVFEHSASEDRHEAFDAFIVRGGPRLLLFAAFQVLERRYTPLPWSEWPEAFRRAGSPEVEAFILEHEHEIRLELWLQFEADRQLALANETLLRHGGRIGLYRDLAVGVNPHGADTWIDPDIYVTGISVGAPPDALGPRGQVWGLPPLHPIRLQEQAYAPFIDMLRANMRHAGALRIDHVMGLFHLFWVPENRLGREGVYVDYPFDDFLGILALESHRQECMVIGEDLGTVPEGLRERMAQENIFSYRVFFFERWESGLYRRPDNYPRQALACATSHDMAPIVGFWRGWDIDLRYALGIAAEEKTKDTEYQQRILDRQMLKAALIDQYMILPDFPEEGNLSPGQEQELVLAVHSFLAFAPSALAMLNLDDVVGEVSAVNIPGTLNEYPNWRRRLRISVEDLVGSEAFLSNVAAMARYRSR